MAHSQPIRRLRRQHALSEVELADLLALSEARICRLEQKESNTRLATAFGLQIIFAIEPRALFPNIYAEVEESVMRRSAGLEALIRDLADPVSVKKQRLLAAMVERAGQPMEI